MDPVAALSDALVRVQVQPATLGRYEKRYQEFCAWAGDDALIPPADRAHMLRRYMADLTLANFLPRALAVSAAVSFFWKVKFGFDPSSDPAFAAFVRGLRNFAPLLSTPRPRRNELPVQALARFFAEPPAGLAADKHVLICAALAYGMRAIQRGGQVADLECRDVCTISLGPGAVSSTQPGLAFPPGFALRVTVRTSKTDPQGRRPYDVVIDRGATSIDPVHLIDAYTRQRFGVPLVSWNSSVHASSTAKFFTDRGSPVSTTSLRDWVRLVAAHSRLPGYFGSHSLRIAGACWAVLGGLSLEAIMAIGGWKTQSATIVYLRSLIAATAGASRAMGF